MKLITLVAIWMLTLICNGQRTAIATGVVTFSGTGNTTNSSMTAKTKHVANASTALSIISIFRSDLTVLITNLVTNVSVQQSVTQDTLTINLSANFISSAGVLTNTTYRIDVQYIRITNFSTY
jgi:hypothetical protein